MKIPDSLATKLKSIPIDDSEISHAPGRVNIIGEHTDYNDGFVLPASINLRCWAAASARSDRILTIHSENTADKVTKHLDEPYPSHHWSDYPFGVAVQIELSGVRLPGVNLYIQGDVPLGAGLSSSAAI